MAELTAPRWRMVLARVLVVLGILLAVASVLAGYVRYQALDTPTVEKTADDLLADDEIRELIAATLVDQLFANVDVQANLEQRLPPDQKRLAGPLAAAIRALADRSSQRLFERPRLQSLWVSSIARSHEQLIRVLDDDLTAVQSEGGYVVLDLQPLVIQLGDQVAIIGKVGRRLPPDAGRIRIMQADQLETAQDLTELLKRLAAVLWLVPLALFGIALWLAEGRRRGILRMIAVGLIVAGLLVLLVRRLAGDYFVDHIVKSDAVRPAAHDAWVIFTGLLADGGWTLAGLGVIASFAVWLIGPSTSGTAARRALAPFLARWEIAFGSAAVLFFLLILWGPTAQTQRARFVIGGAILLALAVQLLRRQAAREFPEASGADLSESMRSSFARLRGSPPDTRLGELERLARLREQGVLSDAEVAAEKARVLGSPQA